MDILELFEDAVEVVASLMRTGTVCAPAFSGGKDSSVTLLVAIHAAKRVKGEGFNPSLIVMNACTGVENPENDIYAALELDKVREWCKSNDISNEIIVAKPSLAASWAMRIIGGRALPSFPGTNHDCTVEWKINPMQRERKKVLNPIIKSGTEVVTLIGTRFDESEARSRRMKDRGESSVQPQRNKDGELVLAPIALFTTDEVWEILAMAQAGEIESYSSFEETFRLYADGGGTSCAVVSDMAMSKASKACGSRFGCWSCVAVANDVSMGHMIAGDKRYAYMAGLNRLRNFISATRWDMNRRLWVGRSIKNGYISIGPDVYSPSMMRELLRYSLTLDRDERIRARDAGEHPRFEIVSMQALVGIDAMWSLQAYHKPHQAVMDYLDIVENGAGYYPPENMPVAIKPPKMPKTKYLYVGNDWGQDLGILSGMRDASLEAVSESGMSGCMGIRTLGNGAVVMDVNTDDSFDVDEEGVELAFTFELEQLIETHKRARPDWGLTAGYRYWVRMGIISLSPQQVVIHDMILRRSHFKEREGIAGEFFDLKKLLLRCVDSIPDGDGITETEADIKDGSEFLPVPEVVLPRQEAIQAEMF